MMIFHQLTPLLVLASDSGAPQNDDTTRERNPRSCRILRLYARFLSEIKDDQEQAEFLFQEADDNEGEHGRKKNERKEGKSKAVTVEVSKPLEELERSAELHRGR